MMKQIKEICYKESSNISQKSLAEKNGCYAVYGASGYLKDIDTFQQSEPYIGIVKDGSGVGRVNIYPEKTSLLSTLQYIKPKEGTNLRFLFYALNSIDYKKFLEGAAIPHIYFRDYGEELVYCPSLSEQTRIVSLLDDAFGKLERSREKALKLLDDAKEIFQAQLKKEMTPKEGWEVKKLNEIVAEDCPISYGIVQPGDDVPNGIPVVRPVDLQNKIVTRKGLKRVLPEISDSYKRTILKGKELLICVRGTTGVISIADEDLKDCNVTRGIVPLSFREGVDYQFIYYQTIENKVQEQIASNTKGVALKQINMSELRLVEYQIPPLSDQSSIVSRLDVLSSQLKQIEEKTNKYLADLDELKQSLLKKAFEGKI